MMSYPTVTLIINARDSLENINQLFQSIKRQTILPCEIICFSSVKNKDIIHNSSHFTHFSHIYLDDLSGKAAVFNTALQMARGDVLCFFDSTDVLFNTTSLEYCLAKLQRDGSDILVADYSPFPYNLRCANRTLSPISHLLAETSQLRWQDFPEFVSMTKLCNKLFTKKFLEREILTFDELFHSPEYPFHAHCCDVASFSLTERCFCYHGTGKQLSVLTPSLCANDMSSVERMAHIIHRSKNSGCIQVFCEYLCCLALSFAGKIIAANMTEPQMYFILKRWADILHSIPLASLEHLSKISSQYIIALRMGKIDEAAAMLPSTIPDISGEHLFSKRFNRLDCEHKNILPATLKAAYSKISSQDKKKVPLTDTQATEIEVLPEGRILVEWGKSHVEILDPLTNQSLSGSTINQESHITEELRQIFPSLLTHPPKHTKSHCKVLTLCSTVHGGAGEGSMRRVRSLRSLGIEARLVGIHSTRREEYVGRLIPSLAGVDVFRHDHLWKRLCDKLALSRRNSFRGHEFFPSLFSAVDFRQLRPLVEWADIVHLHWVDGLLDFEHMADELGSKPVVWTLSGMNPFTGGCHYSEGCEKYTNDCQNCPQFEGADAVLPHQAWLRKEKALQRLNICAVSPSPGMASLARKSSLFRNIPVHFIPNAYPVDSLVPLDRHLSRDYCHLPLNKKILLFGATSQKVPRKGYSFLCEALNILKERHPSVCQNLLLVTFGLGNVSLPFETHNIGFIPQTYLPMLFSAADVTAIPSLEDTGPMTLGESLLCGTRVVAFSSLSLLNVLGKHNDTVYIAKAFDTDDFAKGLAWALSQQDTIDTRMHIRQLAESQTSPLLAAQRHVLLYQSMLKHLEYTSNMAKENERPLELKSDLDQKKFTFAYIDAMPYPSAHDSEMVKRHWVQRREARHNDSKLFHDSVNFNDFTYALKDHMHQLIQGYLINSDQTEVQMEYCDLKAYQDGLCTAFIDQMFPAGNAKILEIGGGYSRILAHFTYHQIHECWNLDKFEGIGNGPCIAPVNTRYKVVPAYIGDFCSELPNDYFDFVFSTSVLEHVPEDEATFSAIYKDIERVLKPGGFSMHLVDFGLTPTRKTMFHGIVKYLFTHAPVLNTFVAPLDFTDVQNLYCMSRFRFDWRWRKVLQMSYAEFGMPCSINIFWKKEDKNI